jgi:hypothetical protein
MKTAKVYARRRLMKEAMALDAEQLRVVNYFLSNRGLLDESKQLNLKDKEQSSAFIKRIRAQMNTEKAASTVRAVEATIE